MRIFAAMSGKQFIRLFSFTASGTFISLLGAACLVYAWYSQVSFELVDAEKALPGEATNYGFDVSKRIQAYYKGCVLFGVAFFGLNSLLNLLVFTLLQKPIVRLLAWGAWILSAGALLLWLATVFKWSTPTSSMVLIALLALAALFANKAWWNHPQMLKIKLSLLTGGNTLLLYHALMDWILNTEVPAYSYGLVAIGAAAMQWLVYKSVYYHWLWIQKSFFIYPIAALISYELALIMNQRGIQFNLTGLYFLLMAGMVTFLYARLRHLAKLSISTTLSRFFFPLFLTSFFAFAAYNPVATDYMEMFEMANPANSVMRFFVFNELPFIDFISSHLLYEQLPQYLYTWFNGYDGTLSFMTYGFYYLPLSGLLYYFFFRKLFQSGSWAFAVVLLVPFVPILLPTSFVLTLITLFLTYRLLVRVSVRNGTYLLLWTFFLIFWRVDIAAGTLPALVVIGLLHLAKNRLASATLKAWLVPGLSIVAVVGITYLIWILSAADIHSGALRNLYSALWYFGGAQAHAVVRIAPTYQGPIFLVHHFVFPCLVVAMLIATAFKWVKTKDRHQLFIATSILMLGLFYLFNAQRGLVRHGFIEGSDKHLSSFIYVLIPLFLLQWRKWNYPVLLFVLSSSVLVLLGKHGSLEGYTSNLMALETLAEKQLNLDFSQKIQRCKRSEEVKPGVDKVVEFIDSQLREGQTFLDFSNTPMLYFYTQRAVPSYFNQSLQNIVTRGIQLHNRLDREDADYDIPLVVFSHYPDNWWDNTDGVPNSIRYQNICKEIYQNYAPFQLVHGYQIWKRKDLLPEGFVADSAFFYPRQFKLHQYPSYFQMPEENLEPIAQWMPSNIDKNENGVRIDKIEARIGQYLEVTFKEENLEPTFEVTYYKEGTALGNYTFLTKKGCTSYTIPLWSQYNWHLLKPDAVYLTPTEPEKKDRDPLQKLPKIDWYENVVISEYPLDLEH